MWIQNIFPFDDMEEIITNWIWCISSVKNVQGYLLSQRELGNVLCVWSKCFWKEDIDVNAIISDVGFIS